MTDSERISGSTTGSAAATAGGGAARAAGSFPAGVEPGVDQVAEVVLARIKERLDDDRDRGLPGDIPSAEHAIALREQAPELYDLWLKIAQEKVCLSCHLDDPDVKSRMGPRSVA